MIWFGAYGHNQTNTKIIVFAVFTLFRLWLFNELIILYEAVEERYGFAATKNLKSN